MPYIIAIYGVLIFVGGIIGHAKAGSNASLVMGAAFGLLLLIAAGGMFSKKYLKKGTYFALLLTLVLDAFFTYRYLSTMKFMPSGMLAVISIGIMITLVSYIRRRFPTK